RFTVEPLEVDSPAPKAIRVRRGGFQPVYYIEHRWPIGFDAPYPWIALAQDGALLRWTLADWPIGGDTHLIDTTPDSDPYGLGEPFAEPWDMHDAALLVGRTFQEPVLGFSVTTRLANAGGLTVDIQPSPQVIQPAPVGVRAVMLDASTLSVFWQPVPGAEGYTIRGLPAPEPLGSTSTPRYQMATTGGNVFSLYVEWFGPATPASAPSLPVDVHTGSGIHQDGDGFSNSVEWYLRTDSTASCAVSPGDAAWPPDFNADNKVDATDRAQVQSRLGATLGTPGYGPRYDLVPDGQINATDLARLDAFLGQSCGPPPPQLPPASLVLLQPDVNFDGVVGLFTDIFGVAGAFGASYTAPSYRLWYDLNADGSVDLFNDIFGVAAAFGTQYWPAVNSSGQPLTVRVGQPLSFYVLATRDSYGALPQLRVLGRPAGATFTVSDTGLGRRGWFVWTPTAPQERILLTFRASYSPYAVFRTLYVRAE
ncbi:MAG: dockerin type I domain-containing protein, partial [Candidatus Omnitrophota bacterium]|nr:dockerin type I domain-containing protein [Candidatus Omnitrophota bacterium]